MVDTEPTGKRGRPRGNTATRDVDDELDTLIERRANGRGVAQAREEANELAELWRRSERRYRERLGRELRAEWFAFFSRMAINHARISEDYERRAEALCEED